jgi:SAM-dependent methyltransferase
MMKVNYLRTQELDVGQQKYFSVEQAASVLGVSTATVRNWAKAGHLNQSSQRPLAFPETAVLALKNSISSGDVARLRTRANKSTSASILLPIEYMTDASFASIVEGVSAVYHRERQSLSLEALLFLVSLRVLEVRGEVKSVLLAESFDVDQFHSWKRKAVKDEIYDWHSTLHETIRFSTYKDLSRIILLIPDHDVIGLIYQALVSEGDKSTKGSYYTPPDVVAESLSYQSGDTSTFLDPCCGTGQYLLCAAKVLNLRFEDIYGFDNDQLATRIARINLLVAFSHEDARPNIDCLNAITELATEDVFCPNNHLLESFDFIATNPPWGAFKNVQIAAHLNNGIRSNEAFSFILAKAISLTKRGGRISFILPESVLKIRIHADIRELILAHTRILRISHLGRQFTGVFTPVIRLDLLKETPKKGALVSIEGSDGQHKVEQERFFKNDHFAFDANVTDGDDVILARLYANEFITLKGNADWALGIVTGNNKAFIKEEPDDSMEAIYKGSDVCKFLLKNPSSYISFTPERFQQVAKPYFYRASAKLIYKFISNKLAFAFDDEQRLTLNSANILIPRLPGIGIKAAMAFLNSNVFQYIFKKKFSTHKVLRGDLEMLPFPKISREMATKIEDIVDRILGGEEKYSELNDIIYSIYRVTPQDVACIEKALFE